MMNKVMSMFLSVVTLSVLSCDLNVDGGKNPDFPQGSYILCAGNFTMGNASLWALSDDLNQVEGPLNWTVGSGSKNPLGDVGQSLTIHNDKLYIVMNNSSTVEIMNISGDRAVYENSLAIPGSSPREIQILGSKAYISSWGLEGILIVDMDTMVVVDTLKLGESRQPEALLIQDSTLYCSVAQKSDYSTDNELIRLTIQKDGGLAVDSVFQVCPGPVSMLISGTSLYISGKFYDQYYTTYAAMSQMNLETDEIVTKNFGAVSYEVSNLFIYQGDVYRGLGSHYAKVTDDLLLTYPVDVPELPGLYTIHSVGDYIVAGCTDYQAYNEIVIIDNQNTVVNRFQVGAIPTDIVEK